MRRVVVTGLGLITPVGIGWRVSWEALLAGCSGIAPVRSFDTSEFPVHIGAEVKDFSPEPYLRRRPAAELGRTSQFAVAAARMALDDAALDLVSLDLRRVGVSMGTTSGEPFFVERYNDIRKEQGFDAIPADLFPKYPSNVIPTKIAIEFGLRGPALMIPTACAAGNYAIGYAFDLIRSGRLDAMLAGGADTFSRITYMGFARLGAIAKERCQPFDRNRKGMVPGEGAAVLVLEEAAAARARGAKIYAEILGYGISCDAHHMTAAHPQGEGAVRAMSMRIHAVSTNDTPRVRLSGGQTNVLSSVGDRFSYSYSLPCNPAGESFLFQYTNFNSGSFGGTFDMRRLASVKCFNSPTSTLPPGDYDTVTFTGFGLWSKDPPDSEPRFAAGQISVTPQTPYVGILVFQDPDEKGNPILSNANTKPAEKPLP